MTFNHTTNHSFNPPVDFWRMMENLITSFPFWSGGNRWKPHEGLIKNYEIQMQESFDVDNRDKDIYGFLIQEGFISRGPREIPLKEIPLAKRKFILPEKIHYKINRMGKIIKFLSNHISNRDTVHKFEKFIENMYYYLKEVHNFNPENETISSHGLGNLDDANYERKKAEFTEKYIKPENGLIKLKDFMDYFNSSCRKYNVPLVIFEQKGECYVVHITDVFVEKIIQNIPLFLNQPDLEQANNYFIKAYNERDNTNYSECLNNVRKGMEEIRDFIYDKYTLPAKSGNLHTDLKALFDTHKNTVFDFTKIPETDQGRIDTIVEHFKSSVLLSVKLTNIGAHSSSVPHLIEENTTLFVLGLIASLFPYMLYITK